MWCSPVPSAVSPMYMPGRLRTASRPFRTLIESEPYSCGSGICLSASPTATILLNVMSSILDPHWHYDVLEILFRGVADERAGGGIAESALERATRDIV